MKKNAPVHQSMITVATFDSMESAEAFRRHLAANRIHAVVKDEQKIQRFWFLSPVRSSIHVRVMADLVENAKESLKSWERMTAPISRAIHCPDCDSSRIEFPQMSRQFILPTLMAHVAIALGLQRHRYYCKNCHESWSDELEARKIHATRLAGNRV